MADPDYYFGPKADIFDPVAAILVAAAGWTSSFLEKSAAVKNRNPTGHFEWFPTEGAFFGNEMTGDLHRPLTDVDFRCRIVCYSKTFDGAWRMAQQLASAIRQTKVAAATFESWSVGESSDQPSTLKTTLELVVAWRMPMLEQRLNATGTEKATIRQVGFDRSNPAYGTDDGKLIVPLG